MEEGVDEQPMTDDEMYAHGDEALTQQLGQDDDVEDGGEEQRQADDRHHEALEEVELNS